ncbi:galactose-1-phosphate uridylyltransferase [Candidatus Woesearchaeota archaeon]|nr:galactose-1-phosphate uridylyltransferase [Candidatus Woesearchaeota archaeon]
MNQLRKDYVLNRFVIIASERAKRPDQFKKESSREPDDKKCFFCPGNEKLTPPEIGSVLDRGNWLIRWFANKFSAVSHDENVPLRTDNDFFTWGSAFGYHEVIVETPLHTEQLWDLSEDHLMKVMKVYADRIETLSKKDGVEYVDVFKNHKKEAGTSVVHSHSQVVAYNLLPSVVKQKIEDCKTKFDSCPYCAIIERERGSERFVSENETFIAITPYASRFPFEVLIMPKRHVTKLEELTDREFCELGQILKPILAKLKELGAPFNYYFHYGPGDKDLHLQLEITPRLATWAGFELSTGTIINSVPPENAARFYKEE